MLAYQGLLPFLTIKNLDDLLADEALDFIVIDNSLRNDGTHWSKVSNNWKYFNNENGSETGVTVLSLTSFPGEPGVPGIPEGPDGPGFPLSPLGPTGPIIGCASLE